jgi:hypothetical protein
MNKIKHFLRHIEPDYVPMITAGFAVVCIALQPPVWVIVPMLLASVLALALVAFDALGDIPASDLEEKQ